MQYILALKRHVFMDLLTVFWLMSFSINAKNRTFFSVWRQTKKIQCPTCLVYSQNSLILGHFHVQWENAPLSSQQIHNILLSNEWNASFLLTVDKFRRQYLQIKVLYFTSSGNSISVCAGDKNLSQEWYVLSASVDRVFTQKQSIHRLFCLLSWSMSLVNRCGVTLQIPCTVRTLS